MATIDPILGLAADLLALAGACLFLISAIGLLRLPDFYCRLHAPTKAASLGVLLLALASAAQSLQAGDLLWIEDLAILVFLLLTVPVSAQVLARAARQRGIPSIAATEDLCAAGRDESNGTEEGQPSA